MLKTVNQEHFLWRIAASLLLSLIALILQSKIHQWTNSGPFLILYPVVFLISWFDFASAIASILFTSAAVYFFFERSTQPDINLRLFIYALSSYSIAWMIQFTRMREQIFAQKVRETSQQLYSIVENIQDAFFVVDNQWNILFMNRNHEKITRAKRADHIGKKIWEAFPLHHHDESKYWTQLEKVMSLGRPVEFEEYFAPLNLWTEVRANKTDDGGGAVFYRDITQRKLQEEALASNEKKFRAMADSMPQIVFVSNPYGQIIYLNQQWNEYTGLSENELYQIDLKLFIHPEDCKNLLAAWKNTIKKGTPFYTECRIKNKLAQYRWHLVRCVPITNCAGEIEKWFGTSTDIDEQVRIEGMLNESQMYFRQLANSIPHIIWTSPKKWSAGFL